MKVVFIGAGHVASVLAKELYKQEIEIVQIYSRNIENALILANKIGAQGIDNLNDLYLNADVYFFAVPDDVLSYVAVKIKVGNALIIHTAGSVSKEVLRQCSSEYGVLWPMKMLRKTMDTIQPVSICIDGNNSQTISRIESIARLFSNNVQIADDEKRKKMHLIAAITTNFTNHLYHLASVYCQEEQIDFSFFYPTIEETAKKIQHQHPKDLQAGPAFRGDLQTIEKHLNLLSHYPQTKEIYKLFTQQLLSKIE